MALNLSGSVAANTSSGSIDRSSGDVSIILMVALIIIYWEAKLGSELKEKSLLDRRENCHVAQGMRWSSVRQVG